MGVEKVYKGRDNTNNFILKADEAAVNLSGVTKMELVFDDETISSETSSGVFDWSGGSGGLILSLGGIAHLEANTKYSPRLIVYDADNTSGVDWGEIEIYVY